ncbi:unnamed protein product (macronuclear) [Paramecium tetraurelia]|uniref:Protein kinase domain-containing protein n=1 Tax=Paramecium tetraurelia TaxID=5888 RepID=A0CG51_PARTE|nr:uncharacterized protein GSPATT00038212001 [Paramecium tetraurelia]CAK69768.1 unnamed protein product [Paramecium tetraurelia]|eukprot:XP_001437165.1 hypothetical protein (macronuclear) [Paramecium tetraurelia strain d4-2]
MGSCTQKLKKANQENLQRKHMQKTLQVQHSKNQSIQTQESVQEKKKKDKFLQTDQSLNIHNFILIQTCKLSKVYSIVSNNIKDNQVQTQNKSYIENMQIIQNNLTGRIRVMETLKLDEKQTKQYMDNIIANPLSHPNIAQTHEMYQDDETIHIIHDYCSGGRLSTLFVKLGQGISEHIALKILVQMIESLNYLHMKGFNHGHLTQNSFSRTDESENYFIKLTDIKPIYLKPQVTFEQLQFFAPEVIDNDQDYSIARDVWSIGIIFYKLLTGNLPYSSTQSSKLKQEIRKGILQFSDLQFDKVSTRAKELLSKLLSFNPSIRSDLNQIIKSPMYRKLVSQTKQISQQSVNALTNIKPANVIQSLFLQFLVSQFCQNQQNEIYQMFNKYDQNGDAKLNRTEICELLYQQLRSKEQAQKHVDLIFQAIDTDHNGTIDCDEFIRCIVDRQALITTPNLKAIFKILSNGKGSIHKKRFMQCFQVDQKQTDEMFASITKSKRITFKVFSKTMMELV